MMKIAKGALSMLLSIVLVVGLFPNLAYAVGPASAKSEEQGPAQPAPEVPVTEELVVPTSGNVSFELAEDNSLSKQASAGASRLKAVFGSSRMRALVADAVEGASSEAASDAAEGEADAGVAEQPLVLSTPDEVGSLRSGGDAEERVMDGMSAMDEAPSRAPTATSGGYSYRQVSDGVEVTGYSGAGGDIVVPDVLDGSPVVGIAARAFMNNASLSSVVLPASVSKVGDRAFWGCASLSSVTLAEGLKYLGAEAFSGCAVSSVLVPASLEDTAGRLRAVPGPFAGCPLSSASLAPGSVRVAPGLFSGCSALASVGVPSSVASYGERCFQGCASLASFEVPEGVSEVGDHAFQGCTGLTAMEVPSSVSKVGNYAFWGCASLSSVTLAEGLKYLGAEAFSGCAVSSVLVPASLEDTAGRLRAVPGPFAGCPLSSASLAPGSVRVAPGLFSGCSALASVGVPSSVASYGERCFQGCASLASFEVPEGVSEVGDHAFQGCTGLTAMEVPSSVSKVGNYAFFGCASLSSVTLAEGLKYLGAEAFSGCAVSSVLVPASLEDTGGRYLGPGPFAGCPLSSASLAPGSVRVAPGLFAECASLASFEVPEGVSEVGNRAFAGCTSLASVGLPSSVREVGVRAFQGCTGLTAMEVPSSVSKVGDRAFFGCASLSSVTLAEGLKYLGAEAFFGCAVSSVLIPASLEDTGGRYLGPGPFAGCPLASASLAPGASRVAPGLFAECASLASFEVPEGVSEIGSRAFAGCTSLASVGLPSSVREVGARAFQGCTGLTAMELPSSVSKVGDRAFFGCASLSSVTLAEGLKYLGAEAFSGCAVSSVLIPASLEDTGGRYLGPGPFAGCPLASASLAPGASRVAPGLFAECASLASFEVPEGVSEIGSRAFADCSSLVSLRIPASVSRIGNGALKGCTALTVTCPRNSSALLYAVQNSVPVDIDDYSRALLDPAVCSYSFQRRADGLAALNLRYGFAPAAPAVSVESAEVLLPASSAVREVLVDGTPAIWSFSGGKLSISVKESSASIEALCELPAGAGSASCASVVFKRDGAQGFEVVDFLSSVGSPITLRAPEVTASGSFTVRGRATAGTEVSLSVGGAVVGAATASQTGSYSAEVSIPSPGRRREYAVAASCPDGAGGTVSASVPVLYDPGQAGVTRFVMRYGGKEHDLLGGGPLQATFYPSWYQGEHPFTFEVAFDAPHENLEWVRVVSDKGGERKHLDLAWDEAAGCFSATGWFDPSDRDYVPGALSVSYGVKPEQHTVDFSDPASYDPAVTVPSSWDDVTVTREDVDANTVCYTYSSPTLFNDPDNPATITVRDVAPAIAALEGFPQSVQEALDQGYEPLGFTEISLTSAVGSGTPGGRSPSSDAVCTLDGDESDNSENPDGTQYYYKTSDTADGGSCASIVGFTVSTECDMVHQISVSDGYSGALIKGSKWGSYIFKGIGVGGSIFSCYSAWVKYDDLERAVAHSSLSEGEKAACYKKIATARVANMVVLGLAVIGTLVPGPVGVAISVLGIIASIYISDFDWNSIEKLNRYSIDKMIPFNWLVDPSGYACDALTGQRLAGARATLYFKASEGGEAEEWDASPYGQQNPLVTDGQGCFSWDVPEGWWQVRIEKEGYAPASSDWVRVPSEGEPDLSIPLVPLTAFSAGATFLPQSVAFAD